MSHQTTDSFFAAWRTYRRIVEMNYMYHREIAAQVEAALRAHFGGRAISVLDLGCGDAATLAPVLAGMTLRFYVGVDLSETALSLAADNLKALSCPVELRRDDLLAALGEAGETPDLVHSSFALHHLPTEEKAEFFRRAAERLAKGGLLLLTDVMREEDESLEVYLGRYCDWLRREWTALEDETKETVCEHLVAIDRPETFSMLRAQAEAAGLAARPIAGFGWHKVVAFTRAA